jgi:N-acetylglucosaminyl-diphospho-decaprenol L-rhamnosyltransferase
MSASQPPFGAVVVTHNSERYLPGLFDSLARFIDPSPEVVVVDTGSRDQSADIARERGATVIERPDNPGFGTANNLGLQSIRSEVCVLLNPDIELLDPGLLQLVERARRERSLFVPRLLNADGSVQRSAHPAPGTAEALLPALVHPLALPRTLRLRADPWRSERPRVVGWALAACLVAQTDLLRELGPFDERIFLFYEDLDLALRAARRGVPTRLQPEVRVRHFGSHSTFPSYGGEPHDLLARLRREVIARGMGPRALRLDDLTQSLAFATRAGARMILRRDASRELAQFRAVRTARKDQPGS